MKDLHNLLRIKEISSATKPDWTLQTILRIELVVYNVFTGRINNRFPYEFLSEKSRIRDAYKECIQKLLNDIIDVDGKSYIDVGLPEKMQIDGVNYEDLPVDWKKLFDAVFEGAEYEHLIEKVYI